MMTQSIRTPKAVGNIPIEFDLVVLVKQRQNELAMKTKRYITLTEVASEIVLAGLKALPEVNMQEEKQDANINDN